MKIKTGCSSALFGLHTACQSISSGESSAALICGTNMTLDPDMTISMTEQGVISPTGSSKSFDAEADGYARAEAINAKYIKPLSAALRNGDPIRAVIRSTATNGDGKTSGLSLPNSASHVAMMRYTHQAAGLDCSDTAFVECMARERLPETLWKVKLWQGSLVKGEYLSDLSNQTWPTQRVLPVLPASSKQC